MSDERKKVMNEILPLPEKADRSTPRDRTKAHLSRILAAAGFALSGAAHADATVPGDKKNDKPDGKGKEVQPKPPEEPPSFHVVDPVPEPYINRAAGEGFLKLETKPPGLTVSIDGEALEKTPLKKYKLSAGQHTLSITRPDGEAENFTVEIKPKSTVKVSKDLRPKKK